MAQSRRWFLRHLMASAGSAAAVSSAHAQVTPPAPAIRTPATRCRRRRGDARRSPARRRSTSRRDVAAAGQHASPVGVETPDVPTLALRPRRRREGVPPRRRAGANRVPARPRRRRLGLQRLGAGPDHRVHRRRSRAHRGREPPAGDLRRALARARGAARRRRRARARPRRHPARRPLRLRVHAAAARHVLLPLAHGDAGDDGDDRALHRPSAQSPTSRASTATSG